MVTTQEPAEQSTPSSDVPAQPAPVSQQPALSPSTRMLVLGALAGLVVGAGGVGLAWGLSGSSGAAADASDVCGIVLRTPNLPAKFDDVTTEYAQRWTLSEVAASIAKSDATYQPLADSLQSVLDSFRNFRLDEMRTAMDKARQFCQDL